jgi:Na+/melibiose symporter-like transporter
MLTTLRNRNFALVWCGGLVSLTGDWVLVAGLPLVVYQMTGSTLALGFTAMAGAAPRLLVGSIAGVFVDRWDRRWTMLVADLLLGLTLLPLLTVSSADQLWLIVLVLIVESVIVQFYLPAEGALLPRLVGQDHLVSANALNGLTVNVARLIGPPLGAVLVAVSGLGGIVMVDALSFFAAAVLLLFMSLDAMPRLASGTKRIAAVWREWLDGFRLVQTRTTPRILFLFLALTGLGEGAMRTLFVAFNTRILHGNELTYAALVSAQAVGGLLGSLVLGQLFRNIAPARLLGLGALGLGLIDACVFYAPLFTSLVQVPVLFMGLVGLPVAALQAGFLTLAQTSVEDEFRGRVLGLFLATTALSGLLGMIGAGVLGDVVGILPLLTVQSVVYLAGGGLVLAVLCRAVR